MKRQPSNLSESLHQRLNSYALAASAAGVSMLALAQPAEAKIVYTKANIAINPNTKYHLRFNNDGDTAFTIHNHYYWAGEGASNTLRIRPEWRRDGVLGYASRLKRGVQVGPKGRFQTSPQTMLRFYYTCEGGSCNGTDSQHSLGGQWNNVTGYLGLRFAIDGKTHYGWARLYVADRIRHQNINATLLGYAYETIPNKPIITGKTHGEDVITLQDASLGALAAGANGLRTRRQK
jgi:hypothetical protein